MSDSTAPAATVKKFPIVSRSYTKTKHYYNPPATETVVCEEREYPEDDPNGQYQLWINNERVQNITDEVKRRQEQLPLAWADTRADLDEFIDAEKSKKTRSIRIMLGQLQCLV
jgi:hypothetical protein